jgi:inner membrane protein
VDNLTHSLFGWAIGRTLPHQRWGPWVAPLSILSANLPDFESALTPHADMADFLLYHRGWGHSFLGLALASLGLAVVVTVLGRWFSKRFAEEQRPTFLRSLMVIVPCAMTHLLLDYWNTYGIRPLYPFDPTWIYGDMVFIVDGWVWMILLAAIAWGTTFKRSDTDGPTFRRTPVVAIGLCGLVAAAAVLTATLFELVPVIYAVIWIGLGGTFLWIRRSKWVHPHPRLAGAVGLSALCVYVTVLTGMNRIAHARGLTAHAALVDAPVLDSSASPIPGIPWRYEVLIESETQVHRYSMDVLTGASHRHDPIERNLDDPRLVTHHPSKQIRAWRSFARHPVVRYDGQTIILGDARYGLSQKRADFSAIRLEPEPN